MNAAEVEALAVTALRSLLTDRPRLSEALAELGILDASFERALKAGPKVARWLDDESIAAPAPRVVKASTGGSETILLVEDSDDVRALAEQQLEALGYTVLVVSSGEEALALLGDRHVDLLFTDIVMPGGMSGLELVEQSMRSGRKRRS